MNATLPHLKSARLAPHFAGVPVERWFGGALFGLALMLVLGWFWSLPLHLDTFAEDDLMLHRGQVTGTLSSSVWQALTETVAEKYRPVASLLFLATYRVLGDDFRALVMLNAFSYAALCAGLGYALRRWTGVSVPAAIAVVAAAALSRFAYYHVLQRHGLMEIAATGLALGTVAACLAYRRSGGSTAAWPAIVLFALCLHTHERYVVLAPVVAWALWPGRLDAPFRKWLPASWPWLIVAANIAIKQSLLGVAFLTGTGGQAISIHGMDVLRFFGTAWINLFGFNLGLEHLVAVDFRRLGAAAGVPILLVLGSLATLLAFSWRNGRLRWVPCIIIVGAASATLLSASVTIRQEFRWLLTAELLLIAGLSLLTVPVRTTDGSAGAMTAFLVLMGGLLLADLFVRRHAERFFFVGWLTAAESFRNVVLQGARSHLDRGPVYLVDGSVDPRLLVHYGPEGGVTVLPTTLAGTNALTLDERRAGLFFSQHEGRWFQYFPNLQNEEHASPPSAQATAADVARNPALAALLNEADRSWYSTYLVGQHFLGTDLAKAEYYLEKAVDMVKGGNPYPHFSLGQLRERQGRLREALASYERALALDQSATPPNPGFPAAVAGMREKLVAEEAAHVPSKPVQSP